ncbi:MAG: hypothetical protein OER43_11500 [Gammaproteobacteria bacterium]|nr:hypothetical protein [Gammaproteobacteria bacterium]
MCLFFSFFPATIWVVLGYFIFFSSTKTEGGIRIFGRVLAIWVFIIAGFIPLMAAYVTFAGLCPLEAMLQGMQPG